MENKNIFSFPSNNDNDNDNDMVSSSIGELMKSEKNEKEKEKRKEPKFRQTRKNKNLLISIVIKKVAIWKMLRERITSESAAKYLKIPRKTLERYYDNICKGRKNDFNFNANLQKGIHVLYEYNKSKKTSQVKKEI